jgi:hypothetical protein
MAVAAANQNGERVIGHCLRAQGGCGGGVLCSVAMPGIWRGGEFHVGGKFNDVRMNDEMGVGVATARRVKRSPRIDV